MVKRSLTIARGTGAGVPATAVGDVGAEVLETLRHSSCHPIRLMALYAIGDVVGLGLLSQEDYDQEAEYDVEGVLVTPSGKERALELIPTKLRLEAARELASYIHPKAKTSEAGGEGEEDRVVFYLPSNGREGEVPVHVEKRR